MIKAKGTINGLETFFIGLTDENIKRMRDGKPILFAGDPYGLPMQIFIMAGKDERSIAEQMGVDLESDPRAMIDPIKGH